jgi:hypothetical protein
MGKPATKEKGKDILVRKAPLSLHWRIEKLMETTGLTKRAAVLEILQTGTKDIQISEN